MNIEEYISSGILELYATGALSEAEKAEVELRALQYPEIKAELDLIIDTLDRYAQMHAVTPPAHLRDKVLAVVAQNTPATADKGPEKNNFKAAENNTHNGTISINRGQPKSGTALFNWLVAASLALLLSSSALNIYFYRNWKNSEQNLALAMASQQQYAQNIQQVRQQLNQSQQTLALITDQATLRVPLKGVNKMPEAQVMVYWHRPSQHLALDVAQLPVPPNGKQYQLWALADGKPIDAGLINTPEEKEQLQLMKNVAAAQAFAITLEPQGGSVNPTLDEMVVMGKI